ncbi:Crp/Fnr family transcriptional regulator [Nonomuraea sp. NPDC049607]|uniref:Crp/Fnr family transcriptional regulator n=1 Tax=Nonomuraea sp. NPDC049607 TaxID=3154732 RepID=UPI00341FB3D6
MIILRSGCWVRLEVENPGSTRAVLDIVGPDDLLSGLHATSPVSPVWLGQGKCIGTVLKRGKILEIPLHSVREIVDKKPSLRDHIAHRHSVQLHTATWIHAITHLAVETRVALLLISLLYRYGEHKPGEGEAALAPPLSQPDIAGWIGISTASVARVFKKWKDAGLIRISHSTVTIADIRGLFTLAASDAPSEMVPAWGTHNPYEFPAKPASRRR